ncbi:VOC family protein [Haliea sp. E17]|uniref:VOC family protein n=1 Tax=Haliea sp. E17 TaxID=3401576 RepID=UPI003AB0F4CA
MRIEHANITVSNLDASVAFYLRLLGGKVRWEGLTGAGRRAAHIGDDITYLSLFESGEPGRAPQDYALVGFNHLGFEVDDLDSYRAQLWDMGVEIKGEESYDPGRRLYFYDPDGIEIELVEY